jgi:signal transduction histidine kinase
VLTGVHAYGASERVGSWDRFRVEQVLTNLLTNAARYGDGKPVEITVRRDGERAEVRVLDHGPGIAEADQERIFQRFERATSASEVSGLGLGLYIARQIVEMHGGSLRVESTPGAGAAFITTLPLGAEALAAAHPREVGAS